jgi:hypothetical protein
MTAGITGIRATVFARTVTITTETTIRTGTEAMTRSTIITAGMIAVRIMGTIVAVRTEIEKVIVPR